MVASYARYVLDFRFEARTSRQVMTQKETFFIRLEDDATGRTGIGEAALFRGLSADDTPDFEERLADLCRSLNAGDKCDASPSSALTFGLETALLGLESERPGVLLPSDFTEGKQQLEINGLVWMDSVEAMLESARRKVADGYRCVKIKIGQHDFEQELRMLDRLRLEFGPEVMTLRLDANGAFDADDALDKLKRLAVLDIHSIEQPIKAGHWDKMAFLCENSPLAIALDEELIGVIDELTCRKMLGYIAPKYIILKPSLCGGLSGATRWINEAENLGIGWWVTSALESNVGLEAIAQYTAAMDCHGCQGLGTGQLYTNNFPTRLSLDRGLMTFDRDRVVDLPQLQWTTPV